VVPACGRLDLRLEEGRVELVTACGTFVFTGPWEADERGRVELPGQLANPMTGSSIPALLKLQFFGAPEASTELTVMVTEPAGALLVPTSVLSKVTPLP
jgi:hypothetical protein